MKRKRQAAFLLAATMICSGLTNAMAINSYSPVEITEPSANLELQMAQTVSISQIQQEVADYAAYICENWPTTYRHQDSTGIPDENGCYGFDCSGFANYVLKTVMRKYVPVYDFTNVITSMYDMGAIYNKGETGEFTVQTVSSDDMQLGDIIFFDLTNDGIDECTHCGVYIGNNQFIHATEANNGVEGEEGVFTTSISGMYKRGLIKISRFIPSEIVPMNKTMYASSYTTNVRDTMDFDAKPTEKIWAGTEVTVAFTNDSWAYVSYENGKTGFIARSSLTDTLPDANEKRYVAAASLKLYTEPTTSSNYVTALFGTEVTYRGKLCSNSNYYRVSYNGEERFVYTTENIDSVLTADYDSFIKNFSIKYLSARTYLRSTPSSVDSSNIIQTLYAAESIQVLLESTTGSWCYAISESGESGYVLTKCLMDSLPSENESRTVLKNRLKLYCKTDTSGDYIEVEKGTVLTFHGRVSNSCNYYRVTYNGIDYYIYTTGDIDEILSGNSDEEPDDKPDEEPIDPPTPTPLEDIFIDVKTSDWFYRYVQYAYNNGIMTGVTSNTFGPNNKLNRAMVAQILYAQAGKPKVTISNRFTDVAAGDWYHDAVCWAAEKGVVSGYPDDTFRPKANVTREQLAVMLYANEGKPALSSAKLDFPDVGTISSYAVDAITWANQNSIINGKKQSNGIILLDPKGQATRAEAAAMFMQYIQNVLSSQ